MPLSARSCQLAKNRNCPKIKSMTSAKERIAHEPGSDESWICLCGNRPDSDGFFPCDSNGNEVQPVDGWNNLYVCFRCGRIVDQGTFEIVGQNPFQASRLGCARCVAVNRASIPSIAAPQCNFALVRTDSKSER
jgi:hypothetical protein